MSEIGPGESRSQRGKISRILSMLMYIIEEVVPVITLAITVAAIMIQVFFRYVLDRPLSWPFELSIYAFVWTLYLGAAASTRLQEHVRLDVIYNKLPVKARKVSDIFFNAVIAFLFIRILYPIWDYLLFSYRIKTVALKLPWTVVFAVFPLFLVLVILHNFTHIVRDVRFLMSRDKS